MEELLEVSLCVENGLDWAAIEDAAVRTEFTAESVRVAIEQGGVDHVLTVTELNQPIRSARTKKTRKRLTVILTKASSVLGWEVSWSHLRKETVKPRRGVW